MSSFHFQIITLKKLTLWMFTLYVTVLTSFRRMTHIWSIRDREVGAWGVGVGDAHLWIACPKHSDPQKQERPTATTRIIYVTVAKTSPVQSNLYTLQLALSTVVLNKITKFDSVLRTNCWEHSSSYDSPALPVHTAFLGSGKASLAAYFKIIKKRYSRRKEG